MVVGSFFVVFAEFMRQINKTLGSSYTNKINRVLARSTYDP
jgi:hypothetical protein